MSDCHITPLLKDDIELAAQFLEKSTLGKVPSKVWNHVFRRWWKNEMPSAWILKNEDDDLKGFNACFKTRYYTKGRELDCYCASSWYVDPEARKYSLLLLKPVISMKGVVLNNTPIPAVRRIFLKLKFKEIEHSHKSWILPLNIAKIFHYSLRRIKGISLLNGFFKAFDFLYRPVLWLCFREKDIHVERITEFGAEFDQLWENERDNYDGIVVRDSDNLNFYYTDLLTDKKRIYKLSREGILCGYIVIDLAVRLIGTSEHYIAIVSDLFCSQDVKINSAIGKIVKDLKVTTRNRILFLELPFYVENFLTHSSVYSVFKKKNVLLFLRKNPDEDENMKIFSTSMDGDKAFFTF